MTTTYDPFNENYFDESDLREEMTRVYDLCHGCRLCFKYCTSFPTLFEFVDQHDDQNVAKLTVAEQDQVVDECFNCKLCYVNCPYTPGQHEWELDFPRLMLRAKQVKHSKKGLRERVTDKTLSSTDRVGRAGSALAPLNNKLLGSPNTKTRKVVEKATGVSAERILPPYVKQRFSTWFKKHEAANPKNDVAVEGDDAGSGSDEMILFPTCLVEYSDSAVGKDLVKVAEHNNIGCSLPAGQICCGAPMLHEGDVKGFRKNASANVKVLAKAIRQKLASGPKAKVAVTQPTCGYTIKYDYKDYLEGEEREEAEFVASHTQDAAEYLVGVHKDRGLDTNFTEPVPDKVTYHAPCHLRAQNVGLKSRDLIKLTGTKPMVVAECSGIDGMWGLRATNVEIARGVAKKMVKEINRADNETIVGDCSLANGGIELETGRRPVHPVQFMARAYGFDED